MDSTAYIHSVMWINREKCPKYSILSMTSELEILRKKFQRVGWGGGIDQKLYLLLGHGHGTGGAFLWGGTGPDLHPLSSDPQALQRRLLPS